MDNSKNIALIEKYLRNELDNSARQAFLKQLASDKTLAETFEVEKTIFNAIQVKGETDFRNRLEQIEVERQPNVSLKSFNWRPWAIAASILFLGVLGWFSNQQTTTVSTSDLFADNYKPPTFEMARTTLAMPELVTKAATAYNQKDFEGTINYLSTYLESNDDPKLALVLGASYLELDQWQNAIDIFESVREASNLLDDATWMLSMTYLKMNNEQLAKQSLQQLLNDEFLVTPKRQALAKNLILALEK